MSEPRWEKGWPVYRRGNRSQRGTILETPSAGDEVLVRWDGEAASQRYPRDVLELIPLPPMRVDFDPEDMQPCPFCDGSLNPRSAVEATGMLLHSKPSCPTWQETTGDEFWKLLESVRN